MPVTLTITLADDGRVSVSGPLSNKVLVFGLLGSAAQEMGEFYHKQAQLVQPATLLEMPTGGKQ